MTLTHDAAQVGIELAPGLAQPVQPEAARVSMEKKLTVESDGGTEPNSLGFASDEAARLQAERESKYLTGSKSGFPHCQRGLVGLQRRGWMGRGGFTSRAWVEPGEWLSDGAGKRLNCVHDSTKTRSLAQDRRQRHKLGPLECFTHE